MESLNPGWPGGGCPKFCPLSPIAKIAMRLFISLVLASGLATIVEPVLAQEATLIMPPLSWQTLWQGSNPLGGQASTAVSYQSVQHPNCIPSLPTSLGLGDMVNQGLTWVDRQQSQVMTALASYQQYLVAQSKSSTWPLLQTQNQTTRVPVIMYHDVLPEKEVFFDVTADELRDDFNYIQEQGLTPITLETLVNHLHLGTPLPEKPIVLTFDDGYRGHYELVYPLLQEYNFPATFSVFTDKVDGNIVGRSTLTWEQLQEMAQNPLVTIAAHSVTHPPDLTQQEPAQMVQEVRQSKQRLEEQLGIPIRYFTYPEGHYNPEVAEAVLQAGYEAALTMDDWASGYAEESEHLFAIERFGQSELEAVAPLAQGDLPLPPPRVGFDFASPVQEPQYVDIDQVSLILISGGRPITIHADSRYQVSDILADSPALAGVDGTFFSLEYLDSNTLIGPVLSQSTRQFVPGNAAENPLLNDRPLVLLSPQEVRFIPFQADRHNTLVGLQAEMPQVTDAFVGAAWLVKHGEPQPPEAFGNLFDFDAARDRAFWGINRAGQPVVGVSREPVDSITLGQVLAQAGFRDAVMLDSGASASLAYQGESLMDYSPRPVPHVVGLVPPPSQQVTLAQGSGDTCLLAQLKQAGEDTVPQ